MKDERMKFEKEPEGECMTISAVGTEKLKSTPACYEILKIYSKAFER